MSHGALISAAVSTRASVCRVLPLWPHLRCAQFCYCGSHSVHTTSSNQSLATSYTGVELFASCCPEPSPHWQLIRQPAAVRLK
jgi:hypothetical protein